MVRTENKVSTKRVYAYRRISAGPEKQQVVSNLSYLYIGNRFRAALELHSGFESSHFLFSFDEALNHARVAQIHDVKVPFLHINQLIENKKAINRPKDIIDVIELEKIIKISTKEKP